LNSLEGFLKGRPGIREVLPNLYLIPGQKGNRLVSNSLLILGSDPLLVDAGMNLHDARALSALGVIKRLHFTHMHMDHRLHTPYFSPEEVTVPDKEMLAFQSFPCWLELSGLPETVAEELKDFRSGIFFPEDRVHLVGLREGDPLPADIPARFFELPGHTPGHSGILFPDHSVLFITDYDFGSFGPWYGNRSSDLRAYRASLKKILDTPGIRLYLTSHGKGVFTREEVEREAEKSLKRIEERSSRILEEIRRTPGITLEEIIGRGIFYPPSVLSRRAILWYFERRMVELHIEELKGLSLCGIDEKGRLYPT